MKSPFVKAYLGKDGGKDISSWIRSLRYEDGVGKDNKVTMSIHQANVNDVLDDQVVLKKGEVFFRFGYLEGPMSELHRAKIMDVNVDYGPTITVEIIALDKGNAMKKGGSSEVWVNMTTKAIAKKIAARYGMELEMGFEGKKWGSLPQANRTDLEFLQYVVRREEGGKYGVFVRNNTLYVAERGLGKESSMTIVYSASNELMSFKVRYKEKESSGAVNSTTVSSNNLAGEEVSPRAQQSDVGLGDARVLISEAGEVLGVQKDDVVREFRGAFDSDGEVTKVDPRSVVKTTGRKIIAGVGDAVEARNLGHSVQNSSALKVMTATLEMDGNPLLVPDTVITMAGLHRVHDGNWYVETVSHTVDSQRYLTSTELNRNATKSGEVKAEKRNKTVGPDKKEEVVRKMVIDADTGDVLGVESGGKTSSL